MESNNNNNFARSIWDIGSYNINQGGQSEQINLINDPLVANFIRSQMIMRGNTLNRGSMFNFDGFLEKVEDEKKKLIELVSNNFEKSLKEIKLEKIQIINFVKEDDEDDPCFIYLCPICCSFKSVYPVQCLRCEKIYCVECSKNMINKKGGCSCGLKPYEAKEIGPTTRQTIDKFKIKCPNINNQCSKIMNFERINYHLSQDCLNIDYKYTCKHCKIYIEACFWKIEVLRNHLMQCDEIIVECEFCHKQVIRKNFNEHSQTCEMRKIKCEDCYNEMVFSEFKEKHSKSACLDIIKNHFLLEMQAVKEENSNLRREYDLIKSEFENQNMEIQNSICEKQNLINQRDNLNIKLAEKEERLETIKIEYDKNICDLNLKLNEEKEINVRLENIKTDYDKIISDLNLKLNKEKEINVRLENLRIEYDKIISDFNLNKKETLHFGNLNKIIN